MSVRPYDAGDAAAWDDWVGRARNGTFLHTRRFLGYHGDRFTDASLVLGDGSAWTAALPAALDPDDPTTVVSHPGLTYGGLLHDRKLAGEAVVRAFEEIAGHYRDAGRARLVYKPVPWIYHRTPVEDDVHALVRLGARPRRAHLASVVPLPDGFAPNEQRRRSAKRAEKAGVRVAPGEARTLWPILEARLRARFDRTPVHTLDEIERLVALFPDAIVPLVASIGDKALAGTVLFVTPTVVHAQYITGSEEGDAVGATDAALAEGIARAIRGGARYFDFGISNRPEDGTINEGLFAFKHSFGSGSVTYPAYELPL